MSLAGARAAVPAQGYATRKGVLGWILFDWAAQPYFTLITTFVFAPFFANFVAANPVQGQSLWGYATGVAGFCIAALSPVLGAIADGTGRRKRWILGFGVLLCVGAWMLWYAVPGAPNAVAIALIGYIIAAIGVEFATAFNNAMMPTLVPPEKLGRLSGYGWATGYVGGLITLVLVLGFLAGDPETGKTLLGGSPLFGLDVKSHEGDRASGPLTALWFLIFITPMLLFTPDSRHGLPLGQAVRQGLGALRQTLTNVRAQPVAWRFLIANMVYTDGLNALFTFGGIYAAGAFGWSMIELGVFGILLNITAIAGAIVGGWLDDRIGPKRVIVTALMLLALLCAAMLSLTPGRIFFAFDVTPPKPGDGLFGSPAELWCLAVGGLIGAVGGPLQAASRTMLVRIAPPERVGEYFGLFALSGKVTSFVAPIVVGLATSFYDSQRLGLAVLVLFFAAGWWLIRPVPGGGRFVSGAAR